MKKILLLLTVFTMLCACQESMEDRAARDAKETTQKRCPLRVTDDGSLILERITFDKATHVWCMHYLLDADQERLENLNLRDVLLKDLKNSPSYKPYMDNGFTFEYVYRDMKSPKDTLVHIMLTQEDYRK